MPGSLDVLCRLSCIVVSVRPGTLSCEATRPVLFQARSAAFDAAGLILLRLLESLLISDLLGSLWRRVVSIAFRLSGLDPWEVAVGGHIGEARYREVGELSPLFDSGNCERQLDLDATIGISGIGGGLERSK